MKTPKRNGTKGLAGCTIYEGVNQPAFEHARWKRKNREAQYKRTIARLKRDNAWLLELLTISEQQSVLSGQHRAVRELLAYVDFQGELPELLTKEDVEKLIRTEPSKRKEKLMELREFNQKLACASVWTNTMIYPIRRTNNQESIKTLLK